MSQSYWNRIIRVENNGRSFIQRIWREGKERSSPSLTILHQYLDWRKIQSKLPGHVHDYLSGYYDALNAFYQNNYVRFMYNVNGNLYGIDRNKPDYYENFLTPQELCEGNYKGNFYWSHSLKEF